MVKKSNNCQREFELWKEKINKNMDDFKENPYSNWPDICLYPAFRAGYEAARKEGEDAKVQE